MKIVVMGAGGVGGYFGARLAEAGNDVTFVARGSHLAAMQSGGLKLVSPNGNLAISNTRVVAEPADAGSADVVIFAVKLGDTEAAARAVRPLVEGGASVFVFQNGVEGVPLIGKIVGEANVVPGVAKISAHISAPGEITQVGTFAILAFGETDGGKSARAVAFLEACEGAGFDANLTDEINRQVWLKFAMLASFAGVTSLTRSPIAAIRADSGAFQLLETAVTEAVMVGAALQTGLGDADIAPIVSGFASMPEAMTSSMAHDLSVGKPLELFGLSGAIVRLGQEVGIATPTHQFIVQALGLHAGGSA